MAIYRVTDTALEKVAETTFAQENVLERRDLQRLLRADISVLQPDLMVVAEEFGNWEDSSRRIDLLCIDREAHLVVVELKRTDDGGHMELQAIRYAAMISSLTFEQLVAAHARFLGDDENQAKAQQSLLSFLEWDSATDARLSDENVRILLVAANFSIEVTTTVLWLNKRDLDITCIRLKPYRLDQQLLIDVQQIIPLPEAADYETKIRAQQQEGRRVESARHATFRRFWRQLIDRAVGKTTVVAQRTGSSDHWLSGTLGRAGFVPTFSLLQEEARVEIYIDLGKGSEDRNLLVFKELEKHKVAIEKSFGGSLDWQELEEKRGCRISHTIPGGWKTPEVGWPTLQDRFVNEMVRLEKALKAPIFALQT
jgi:hypothetical protein